MEFALRDIPFDKQPPITLEYKGHALRGAYHLDFVCFSRVIVEVKATSALVPADEAQLLNYLAMTRLGRGLLINSAPGLSSTNAESCNPSMNRWTVSNLCIIGGSRHGDRAR